MPSPSILFSHSAVSHAFDKNKITLSLYKAKGIIDCIHDIKTEVTVRLFLQVIYRNNGKAPLICQVHMDK